MRGRRCLPSLIACVLAATAPAQANLPAQPFVNRNGSFHIKLPADWRQIAPNEARKVGELPQSPTKLGLAQPNHFYAVGPIERWLAGDFANSWLYVVEQDAEWFVADAWQDDLRAMWDAEGKASGCSHRLERLERAKVGSQEVDALTAVRVTVPADGRQPTTSFDVYAPAGGKQLSLSFTCLSERFEAELPAFRAAVATLTFARAAKAQATLGDRLWTPLLTGGGVAIVLLLIYKQTRGRR